MWGYWFFLIIESIFLHFNLPTDQLAFSNYTYIVLILINSFILILLILTKYGRDQKFAFLLVGAFIFRIALMFWSEYFSHIFTLPNSGADEMTYYYNAMSAIVKEKEFTGYALLFSWQAKMFGLSKLYGKFINVILSISSIIILRKILIRLDMNYTSSIKTIRFASFLPNYAILSSLLLRESIIVFLVASSAYYFINWWKGNKLKDIIISVCISFGAAWLHSGMIAYTLGIIAVFVSSRRTKKGRYFRLFSFRTLVLSSISFIVVLTILMNTNLGITDYFRDAKTLEDIVSISDAYEEGGSAYNANLVNNDSTVGFIINTPIRMFYFLFSPLPWYWRGSTDIIAFLFSSIFYGYVFFKMLFVMNKSKNASINSAFLLIAFLALMMFGWGVSNSGTALRHRDKMVIHYLIMYALIQDQKHESRKNIARRRDYEV